MVVAFYCKLFSIFGISIQAQWCCEENFHTPTLITGEHYQADITTLARAVTLFEVRFVASFLVLATFIPITMVVAFSL